MSASERHILIIGAGILGLSSAWYLQKRGARVTILDREPIKDAASCGNAGLISLGHPPLTRPGVSIQGLKWMFDKRSPLYIKPRLDGDLARWLWTFHRHCTQKHYEGTMEVLCELGRLSADCFESILAETEIDCDWQRQGWDDVCLHESSLEHAEEEARILKRFGFHSERVDGDTLRAEAPAYTDAVCGAMACDSCVNVAGVQTSQHCAVDYSMIALHMSYLYGVIHLWSQDASPDPNKPSGVYPGRASGAPRKFRRNSARNSLRNSLRKSPTPRLCRPPRQRRA